MAQQTTDPGKAAKLESIVADKMPGWKIVPLSEYAESATAAAKEAGMKVDKGPSIARLRRKFGMADAADNAEPFAGPDPSVETVQIQPPEGGTAKTADVNVETGEVKIVQG
jgi:hypothetical protein